MMVRNDKGELKIIQAVPQVGISLKMMSEMRHYEKAFGLTPLARSERLEDLSKLYTDEQLHQIATANT